MKCRSRFPPRARRIALLLADVDGVLTDGRIYLTPGGAEIKGFNARDGAGLRLAQRCGIRTGIISGRAGAAVRRRATELQMDEVHLKARDKLSVYEEILRRRGLDDEQVCYIGDDLLDLPILGRAGLPVVVANAHDELVRRAPFVTRAPGGHGAVREVVDAILKAQGRWQEILENFAPPTRVHRRGPRPGGRSRP